MFSSRSLARAARGMSKMTTGRGRKSADNIFADNKSHLMFTLTRYKLSVYRSNTDDKRRHPSELPALRMRTNYHNRFVTFNAARHLGRLIIRSPSERCLQVSSCQQCDFVGKKKKILNVVFVCANETKGVFKTIPTPCVDRWKYVGVAWCTR